MSHSSNSRRHRRDGHRRAGLIPTDDETNSVASSETLIASEIPDDVLRFPGVDSSSDTEVASTVDESFAQPRGRDDDEIIEGSYRHYYLTYYNIDVRQHPRNPDSYQNYQYQHQQPSSSQGWRLPTHQPPPGPAYSAWNYRDEEPYEVRDYEHNGTFNFTQDDVDNAVEHLLELALLQVRRERSGRGLPTERERQLRAQAPFLLTSMARREVHDSQGRPHGVMAAFTRRLSAQVYHRVMDAQNCVD